MTQFKGKTVLISGGARGQGAAEATLLVAQGAKVIVADVLEDEGRALAKKLGEAAVFVRLDVSNETDWAKAVQIAGQHGGLHGLVNGAGIYLPKPLLETDLELWERHIRINQTGCFLGMKAAVPLMERSGGGSIVNISSTAGLRAAAQAFAYSASKWAIRGMTKTAAVDLAAKGIRVNSVHPGPIETEMLKQWTPEVRAARLQALPMHRTGTVDEVAHLVLFLLSDQSSYITGAEVSVDGGATA